jgi:hypothetical protein
MGKRTSDRILDGFLSRIQDEANSLVLCLAEPDTFAEAQTTLALAARVLDSSDFLIADAPGGGRRVTVAAQTGVDVTASGLGNHVALLDTLNSRLLLVTICDPQLVVAGRTVNIPAWNIIIPDPV